MGRTVKRPAKGNPKKSPQKHQAKRAGKTSASGAAICEDPFAGIRPAGASKNKKLKRKTPAKARGITSIPPKKPRLNFSFFFQRSLDLSQEAGPSKKRNKAATQGSQSGGESVRNLKENLYFPSDLYSHLF